MFPILFCEKSTGKVQEWRIWVESNKIYRQDGQVGGKMKEPSIREVQGNTLRTPEEQAMLEAEKYWIKQVDKGYKPAEKDKKGNKIYQNVITQKSQNGGMNRGVKMWGETQITTKTTAGEKNMVVHHYPMLSKCYLEHLEKVEFPCHVQPKLDGLRALAQFSGDNNIILESRGGKNYVHLQHIKDQIGELLKNHSETILDGELYVHSFENKKNVERFQFLSEACKITRSEPHPKESFVEYWVFDIWHPEWTFNERYHFLKKLFKNNKQTSIKLVETVKTSTHSEIEDFMESKLKDDYEGIMIRNTNSLYHSKNGYHCTDLLKYKRFEDEEWEIVGAEPCKGNQAGAVKWICEKDGKRVVAKQMGSVESSKELYNQFVENQGEFLGQHINIRFNDRSKDGVPRFPRATAIRHDHK